MGPIDEMDWSGVEWIGANSTHEGLVPAPLLRAEFSVPEMPIRARAYVSAPGTAALHVNGQQVGTAVLDPAATRFDRTVLFSSYDIDGAVVPGRNLVGIVLGRGKYAEARESVWLWHEAPWWDQPKALVMLRLECADGFVRHVCSDPAWEWIDGPVRADSLLGGEEFDASYKRDGWTDPTQTYGDVKWQSTQRAAAPAGELRAQRQQPIRVIGTLPPVGRTTPRPGTSVVDFGRQLAGWVRLETTATDQTITVAYGEKLLPGGLVDIEQNFIQARMQVDTVRPAGRSLTHEPRFSYKGFRYVQIDCADPAADITVEARLAHTDVASIADFRCSEPLLNQIHEASRRSILENLHGISTDTPIYEKNGWTGDAYLSLYPSMINFDMPRFYTKWLQDIADCQRPTGEFPSIIPAAEWGYTDSTNRVKAPIPAWDIAYAEIAWALYWYHGDVRVLDDHYPRLRRYLQFLVDRYPDLIATGGLGDWHPPYIRRLCPEGHALYSTAYFFHWAVLLAKIARVLGKATEADGWSRLAARIYAAFNKVFGRPVDGQYAGEPRVGYRQAPNVVALGLGLVPEEQQAHIIDALIADLKRREHHLDTGSYGTRFLFEVLTRYGHVDDAFDILTRTDHPSYGYWFARGESTLWEGCTPQGDVEVAWEQSSAAWQTMVTVPANTSAELHLPDGRALTVEARHHTFQGQHR